MIQEGKIVKINSYDFFGYLAPGLIIFMTTLLSSVQMICHLNFLESIIWIVKKTQIFNSMQFISFCILIVVVSYILGHLSASLSALIFEKTIIGKVLRYPYERLVLGKKCRTGYYGNLYRSLITLFFLFILSIISNCKEPALHFTFLEAEYKMPPCSIIGTAFVFLFFVRFFDTCLGFLPNKNLQKSIKKDSISFLFFVQFLSL